MKEYINQYFIITAWEKHGNTLLNANWRKVTTCHSTWHSTIKCYIKWTVIARNTNCSSIETFWRTVIPLKASFFINFFLPIFPTDKSTALLKFKCKYKLMSKRSFLIQLLEERVPCFSKLIFSLFSTMVNTVLCMIIGNHSERLYIIEMKCRFGALEDKNILISTFNAISVWPPCLRALFVKLNLLLLSDFVNEFPEAIHYPFNKKKTSLPLISFRTPFEARGATLVSV